MRLRLLLVLGLLLSCRARPAADTAARSDTTPSAQQTPAAETSQAVPDSARDSTPDSLSKPAPDRPPSNRPPAGGNPVTVSQLLDSPAWNGQTVSVTGVCLGYKVPPVAVGSPPRTRSDWQLESSGAAIYVTGPLPTGCSATEGSPGPVTITALVQEDTLRALGNNPSRSRRYLEWRGLGGLPSPRQ